MKNVSLLLLLAQLIGLSGCASVEMQKTSLRKDIDNAKVLVNFVRPSVLLSDGIFIDLWDSDKFIGSLGAGKMIQYETDAGKHVFIARAGNCSYATGDLVAGKRYFVKANIFPGVIGGGVALGVAKFDDPRVPEWYAKLTPVAATEKDRNSIGEAKKAAAKDALNNFEVGRVSSFAVLLPQDGR